MVSNAYSFLEIHFHYVKCNKMKIQLCYTKIKNTIKNPYYKWQHYINKLLLTFYMYKYKILVEVAPSEVTCNVKILNRHHFIYNTANLSSFIQCNCIPLVNKTVRNVQSCK